MGYAASSHEYYLALPNGNVDKSRSVVRVVPSGRWDQKSLLAVQGIPGKLTMCDDSDDAVIEAFYNPHENLDDAERALEIPKPQIPEPWIHPALEETKGRKEWIGRFVSLALTSGSMDTPLIAIDVWTSRQVPLAQRLTTPINVVSELT